MARLRNKATGIVVNVDDSKSLDGYEPAPADKQPKSASSTSSKSSTKK